MLYNFFKIGYRNLIRNKGFSFINISGLAIGMASAMLIMLWVRHETSYDLFHVNRERIYQVWGNDVYNGKIQSGMSTPEIMQPVLQGDVPEIDQAARISWGEQTLLSVGDKRLKASGNIVDPSFLNIFSFPLLRGNAGIALRDPYSIVITESLARAIFGKEDPMGRIIRMENEDDFKVTGIMADLPRNSQFNFEYLMSYDFKTSKGYIDKDWTDVSIRTFVMLKPHASFESANRKIKDVVVRHSGQRARTVLFLYPLDRLRLYSNFENGVPAGGRIERVKTFTLIAGLILLIACINFMNLSTARSEKRAREVGVRKVVGAQKASLVGQFLAEAVFMATISGALALLLLTLVLPAFNQLLESPLSIDFRNGSLWLAWAGFVLVSGFLAGAYPAFFLSSFRPILVLKGGFHKVNALVTPRKIMVILQFTFAIGLIVSTIVIERQINFAQQRESGYQKKNLGYVFIQGDINKNYLLIKNALLASGAATGVSKTQAPLTQNWSSGMSMRWEGMDPQAKIQINRYTEDGDLVKTAGMRLVEGRDIDIKNYPTDSTACLISESAVRAMGFSHPIGQRIFDDPINWHVVGVISDFILESPFETIKPFMVKGPMYGGNVIHIRLNPGKPLSQSLAKASEVFKKYNAAYPFEFHFIDQEYNAKFADEQLTGKLALLFAGLTLFISCLGLFGLASYMAENRVKEIGIRKILGASIPGIAALLSREFVILVMISLAIASPIAWWSMSRWLSNYSYHIPVSIWVFLEAGLAAILIALLTVSIQVTRAALANPVKSLRTE